MSGETIRKAGCDFEQFQAKSVESFFQLTQKKKNQNINVNFGRLWQSSDNS